MKNKNANEIEWPQRSSARARAALLIIALFCSAAAVGQAEKRPSDQAERQEIHARQAAMNKPQPKRDQYFVWGSVSRPGDYAFPEIGRAYLLDAIVNAGEDPRAELRNVCLVRSEGGNLSYKTINVYRMMRKGNMADNVLLKPDDVVFVSPRHSGVRVVPADMLPALLVIHSVGIVLF